MSGSVPDRRDEYVGKNVTILDNRDICAGAGFCTDGLPTVFDMKSHPWIDVAGDTVQKIIETVRKCPSGALSYAVDGVEHRDDNDRPPSVSVTVAGPYRLKGSADLEDVEWAEGASKEHFSLCRCGGSQRKPFCDGSHWTVWKDGPDTDSPATEAKGPRPTTDEPYVGFIHDLAVDGLSKFGSDGPMTAMGVSRSELPTWDDIQIMAAQLDPRPLQEGEHVATELVIGPNAKKPLHVDIPLFVTDMSYGALSEEAKVSLSKGAELAGTAVSLMQAMARACGHDHPSNFHRDDIATWSREMADLTGIDYAGFNPDRS